MLRPLQVALALAGAAVVLTGSGFGRKEAPTPVGPPPLPGSVSSTSSSRSAGAVASADSTQHGSALAAAIRLRSDVDELGKRVDRLDPEAYARPAGAGCADACDLQGVDWIVYSRGEARCSCRKLKRLGVHRLVSSSKPAMERAPEERGLLHPSSQASVDELGAVAVEDSGRAGLSFAGGTP